MSISAMTTQMGQYVSIGISYEKCTPLSRGPLYGLLYNSVGIGLGFLAHAVGGWVSVPLWLLSVLLFTAGVWTALFTGFWLAMIRRAERERGERP
jgi:hypothetical protein